MKPFFITVAMLLTACGDARTIDCLDGCNDRFVYVAQPAVTPAPAPTPAPPEDDEDKKKGKSEHSEDQSDVSKKNRDGKDKEDHGKDK